MADSSSPAPDANADTGPDIGSGTGPDSGDEQVSEKTKSAFAAALERKKAAAHARSAHLDGQTKVGGSTANRKATRTFRRKSGSA